MTLLVTAYVTSLYSLRFISFSFILLYVLGLDRLLLSVIFCFFLSVLVVIIVYLFLLFVGFCCFFCLLVLFALIVCISKGYIQAYLLIVLQYTINPAWYER